MSVETAPALGPLLRTEQQFDAAIRPLYRWLLNRATDRTNPNDAPDVVQETLVRAWKIRGRYDSLSGPGGFAAWMLTILDGFADENRRRAARRGEVLLPTDLLMMLAESSAADFPDPASLDAETWLAFRNETYKLLETTELTPRQEMCIHSWLSGQTIQEIAEEHSLHPSTVWEHIQAGAARLRKSARKIEWIDWYREVCKVVRYFPPPNNGSGLARERLRVLQLASQRSDRLCTRRAG